jgi:hypothetical protein
MEVALAGVELRLVRMPLAEPFVTAHGARRRRDIVIVRALVTRPIERRWPGLALSTRPMLVDLDDCADTGHPGARVCPV